MGELRQDATTGGSSSRGVRPNGWARFWSPLATAVGTFLGIAVLRAAHLQFPPTFMMWRTWPQWVVDFSVLYTLITACAWIVQFARRAAGVGASSP